MSVVRSIVGGVLLLASVPAGFCGAMVVVGLLALMLGTLLMCLPIVGVAIIGLYLLRPCLCDEPSEIDESDASEREESFPWTGLSN